MQLRTGLQAHIFISRTFKFFSHLFTSWTIWREYGIVFQGLIHLVFELAVKDRIIWVHKFFSCTLLGSSSWKHCFVEHIIYRHCWALQGARNWRLEVTYHLVVIWRLPYVGIRGPRDVLAAPERFWVENSLAVVLILVEVTFVVRFLGTRGDCSILFTFLIVSY